MKNKEADAINNDAGDKRKQNNTEKTGKILDNKNDQN